MLLLLAVLLFVVIAAIVAVECKDLLSSVVALGAVGFGLTVSFLLLMAPDVAIAQIVVEIFSLVLLVVTINKTTRKDTTGIGKTVGEKFILGAVMVFLLIFLTLGTRAVITIPFGDPLMTVSRYYISSWREVTRAANRVTAVLLDFRAYDTLGEATVLFTAVLGALAVLRGNGRRSGKKGESQ